MKTTGFLTSLLLVISVSAHAATYDVYILAGQSNMDGRGAVEDLPKPRQAAQVGTLIYYTNPANPAKDGETKITSGWKDLAPGYSIGPGARDKGLVSNTFGPEVSFARLIAKVSPPDHKIAIIKVAKGGTNLHTDWGPDGYMYKALLTEIDTAMQALSENGDTTTIRGMVWHQGESDCGYEERNPGSYQRNLEELIGNLRSTLKDAALPVVIGELAQTKAEAFRAIQRQIATDNEHVGFSSSTGLKTSDNTHFDADAQIAIGERYAETMATLVPEPNTLGRFGIGALYVLNR